MEANLVCTNGFSFHILEGDSRKWSEQGVVKWVYLLESM